MIRLSFDNHDYLLYYITSWGRSLEKNHNMFIFLTYTLYNQGGEAAATWEMTGVMPASYKSVKLEAGSEGLATETIEFVYQTLHRKT